MGKRDNSVPSMPSSPLAIQPMPGMPGGSGYDYYSIMSSFQHIVVARQMELQNMLLNFIRKRFGVQNAMMNMIVLLVIMNPSKVYEVCMQHTIRYYRRVNWYYRAGMAWIYHKPPPRTVKLEVNYIHENAINHLYVALDWHLKTISTVVTDHDHVLALLKEPIKPTSDPSIDSIQKSYPQTTTTEFKYKGKSIHYSKSTNDTTVYSPSGEIKKKNFQILLWSSECTKELLEKFCVEVANLYAKSKIDRVWKQKMYSNNGANWKEQELSMNKRKVSTVIMADGANQQILDSVQHFIDTEEWHVERGINYKLSFLFYGPPGTGKTSMIKALSYEIERHIHFLNLATVKSDDVLNKLMSGIDFKSTIVVLEDIDAMSNITHSRDLPAEHEPTEDGAEPKEHTEANQLTLSGLLNQLDGLRQTHGMILIMTSNHPEVLDAALIRDGRVDEKILFSYVSIPQVCDMFKNFYNGEAPSERHIRQAMDGVTRHISPAEVESSMRRYYRDPMQALAHLAEGEGVNNGLDLSWKDDSTEQTEQKVIPVSTKQKEHIEGKIDVNSVSTNDTPTSTEPIESTSISTDSTPG